MRPRPRPDPDDVPLDPDLLVEFCGLLLDALQVPEIRAALRAACQPEIPVRPAVVRAPAAAGAAPRRRGQR